MTYQYLYDVSHHALNQIKSYHISIRSTDYHIIYHISFIIMISITCHHNDTIHYYIYFSDVIWFISRHVISYHDIHCIWYIIIYDDNIYDDIMYDDIIFDKIISWYITSYHMSMIYDNHAPWLSCLFPLKHSGARRSFFFMAILVAVILSQCHIVISQ